MACERYEFSFRDIYAILIDPTNVKAYPWIFLGIFFAFASELGNFTFNSDYYWSLVHSAAAPTAYRSDGRILAEALFLNVFGGVYAPTLFLLTGLAALSLTTIVVVSIWKFDSTHVRVISVLMLSLHPFFLGNFSYVNTRAVVPLAVLLSVSAVVTGGMTKGILRTLRSLALAVTALLLYQSAVNFAAVVVLVWAAIAFSEKKTTREVVAHIIAPKLGLIIFSVLLYRIFLEFGPQRTPRLNSLEVFPESFAQISASIFLRLDAVYDYFFAPSAFFPEISKVALLVVLACSLFGLFENVARQKIGLKHACGIVVCTLLAIAATHGITLPFVPAGRFIVYRVLFPSAALTLGIYLLSLKLNKKSLRNLSTGASLLVVFSFIVQVNAWHQFLFLKNLADMDATQRIANDLKSDPEYEENLPLVIIGTTDLPEYNFRKGFQFPSSHIVADMTNASVYSKNWSKDRWLKFFVRFRSATAEEKSRVTENAMSMPVWPHRDSVGVRDGVMIVKFENHKSAVR